MAGCDQLLRLIKATEQEEEESGNWDDDDFQVASILTTEPTTTTGLEASSEQQDQGGDDDEWLKPTKAIESSDQSKLLTGTSAQAVFSLNTPAR
jgi:hypothetical protein